MTVTTAGEQRDKKTAEKDRKQEQQTKDDGSKVLAALDKKAKERGDTVSYTTIRTLAGLSNDRMVRAVEALADEGALDRAETEISIGSGAKRTVQGLRRPSGPSGPSGR